MECILVTGQKVECVADFNEWAARVGGIVIPKKGETYTVREVQSYPNGVGVLLDEIRNGPSQTLYGMLEICFMHTGFRPLTDLLADFMAKRKQKMPKPETVL